MTKVQLKLAHRKWKRQFNQAVARSIAKTITEPVTNSYDSYKRIHGPADSTTGLVGALLALKNGARVVHADLINGLAARPARQISIRISTTAKAGHLSKRECQIIDHAEGMTATDMLQKFQEYGAEKSGASAGHAVRGLFGQGICDVVYSHQPAAIRSIKDGRTAVCEFSWSKGPQAVPELEVKPPGRATKAIRRLWAIPDGNGTCVTCALSDECHIASTERLAALLSGFYMLRLITADPHCSVMLEEHRPSGLVTSQLQYNFPSGVVIGRMAGSFSYGSYPAVQFEATVVRADSVLPTRDAGDEQATGLLVVDETDTVYDQTFFGIESPYLDQVYGIIRLTGVRNIIRDRLDSGEALLTESRDGFDEKREFYKDLARTVGLLLKPILEKEIARRSEPTKALSDSAERRVKQALRRLNDLFEEVTKQREGGGGGGGGVEIPDVIAFADERVQLVLGRPRRVRLLGNAGSVKAGVTVIVDSDNASVAIDPSTAVLEPVLGNDRLLAANFTLTGGQLRAKCKITALTQDANGQSAEAFLDVVDVVAPETTTPPESGLEFSPPESRSAPNRIGTLALLVNPALVPVGTDLRIHHAGGDKSVRLVNPNREDVDGLTVQFTKSHLLPGDRVGRLVVGYRGYGYGQRATVRANCFLTTKKAFSAEARVSIEESRTPAGGVFKDIKYSDLPAGMAKSASELDPMTGTIIVNRLHSVNRAVFGTDQKSFSKAVDESPVAQMRLAEVVVDQCLYYMLAVGYQNGEVPLGQDDPVGNLRRQLEQYKFEISEEVFRHFVGNFRVPRLPT